MINSKRFNLSATALAMLSVFSSGVMAHSEHDKPRYVSPDGVDQGRCELVEQACATVGYAAIQSNKGDNILMSAGRYQIDDPNTLFYLLSDTVPVQPGYALADKYKTQDTNANITTLMGVPVQLANQLRAKGFVVNTDQKGLSRVDQGILDKKLSQYKQLQQSQSNVDCVGGSAGSFSCDNIDLIAHVPLSELNGAAEANDIWGFVDLNTQKEYAIIGLRNGISVVDVTIASEPVVIGSISAQKTTWRDIKVNQVYDEDAGRWNTHAYVTADNASVGLMIVDLTGLPDAIALSSIDETDTRAHNVFMSNVDYSTGVAKTGLKPYLHIAGANNGLGAFKTYGVRQASTVYQLYAPSVINSPGYTHDVSAMNISDDRVNSQCTPVNGQCEIFFDYNEMEVKIWDKTINAEPTSLSNITSSKLIDPQYIHSGWTTEDNKVLLVHDELDEKYLGKNTVLQLFDISDLTNPQPLSVWTGPTQAIDHNGFVRGNRYYMSNYERGLTVLDISDPAAPVQVGYFDTYPISDNSTFHGAWGVYPFLPSGNILVSDVDSGLYILKDKTVGQSDGDTVKLSHKSYQVDEGGVLTVTVSRMGDASDAVTVDYETHVGSASVEDFTMTSGTLSWAAGDSSDKTITISTHLDDDELELTENLFVRLYNPTNGLGLTSPNLAVVEVKGVALPAYAAFSVEQTEVKETDGVVSIAVNRGGELSESLTVDYSGAAASATLGSDYELVDGSISWAGGDNATKFIEITLLDDQDTETNEQIVLNLSQQHVDSGIQQTTIVLRDDESNGAPEVNISDDLTVNGGQTISLIATATDPEGYPLSYQWTQTSGTNVNINNSTSSSASAIAPTAGGALTFEVAVSDDFGVTTTKSLAVTVNQSTTPTPTPAPSGSSGGGSLAWLSLFGLLVGCRRRKI